MYICRDNCFLEKGHHVESDGSSRGAGGAPAPPPPPYWLLHKGALPHFSLNFSITDEVLLLARGRTRCSAPHIIFLDLSLVEMESRSRFQPRPVLGVDAYCPQVWCMGCTTLSSITDYEYCPEVYANGLGVIPEILNCSRILK
jgi:hypothetical protein